ncbi:MAG: spermine synthase [Solirubrobacterales bacterium]|nr:MAG: spermine synthase [Solirubrobacterales bacterium]
MPLEIVVFVVGAASLGTEIAAARLLAPYFGASTIVWANTIAVVLVALSVGYWLGGRLADRRPDRGGLSALVLLAAAGLAVVPLVASPFLREAVDALNSVSVGAFVGSLLATLVLVAIPVLLLGAVAPYALRLTLARVEESGRTAGRLYAISTAGSLAGTFLAALVLIPLVGTRRTFLTFALALALVAIPTLRPRFAVVPAVLAGLLALPVGIVKAAAGGGRVIWEAETEYQYARVIQYPDAERTLELNEGLAVHSIFRPGQWLTGDYWDDFLVLGFAASAQPPARVAILGDAAGTTARAFGHYFPATAIDAVELDPVLTSIGRRLFDLRAPRLHTVNGDARPFIEATSQRYGLIEVDAYRQPYIPFYLTTREFFAATRAHLAPGGVVVVNVGHPQGSDDLERVLSATMRAVFPVVLRDPVEPTNTLLLGSLQPGAGAAQLAAAAAGLPLDLRGLARAAAGRVAPPLGGGEVYTDDRAPVELLVDGTILHYASGGAQGRRP